ncbi:hypothetical protein WA026_010692 [Henosepilachna vigintioctopunctata]|uniref:Kinetochore protein SPC25 n=1 Tax=Henosepilachna vigintioctopunctata TaxID=420089 RepID=A0AAW1UPS2_9CUCU
MVERMISDEVNILIEKTLDTIKLFAEKSSELLPKVDEIEDFEKTVIQFNQKLFSNGGICTSIKKRETETCKQNYSKLGRFHNSLLEQQKAELLKLKSDINELSKKIDCTDHIYETKLNEKAKICSALTNQQLEKDCITAFKLATLSHYSFSPKIKFGYCLNRKTLDFKTFPCDPTKEPTEQEIQSKWDMLKLFINK